MSMEGQEEQTKEEEEQNQEEQTKENDHSVMKFIEESVQILEQAKQAVLSSGRRRRSDDQSPSTPATNCQTRPQSFQHLTSSTSHERRSEEEFRNNFPGLSARASGRTMQTYLPTSRPPSRRFTPFPSHHQRKLLNTWTHEFVCLSKVKAFQTPTANELAILKKAGLGKQKIVFRNKNGDHKHIKETLEGYFPRLKCQNGAFQLAKACMGGSGVRQLSYIPFSTHGYLIQELKEDVRASTVYIVPLNSNIDLTPITVNDVTPITDGLLSKCITCGTDIPIWEFQEHKLRCTDEVSTRDTSESNENSATSPTSRSATSVTSIVTSASGEHRRTESKIKQQLLAIFPNCSLCVIDTAAKLKDVAEAVEYVLNAVEFKSSSDDDLLMKNPFKKPLGKSSENIQKAKMFACNTLEDILKDYRTRLSQESYCLNVNRDEIWKDAIQFYKKCLKDEHLLWKKLEVQYSDISGEDESSDAGALRNEFFDLVLKEFLKRSFCGNSMRYIPRRGDSINFTLFGIMIGHSLLNGGPGIYCLHPYIYEMITGIDENDHFLSLVTKNDIPLNAATSNVVSFIEMLDNIKNQEELDKAVDDNIDVINSCQWETTTPITMNNKDLLMTEIFLDVLVRKRKSQVKSIRDGLALVRLLPYVEGNRDLCRRIFISSGQTLTRDTFLSLLENSETFDDFEKQQSYGFFLSFVNNSSTEVLQKLLQFITGLSIVPPWGLEKKISVKFLEDTEEKMFPEAMSCFNILYLPTVHSTTVSFQRYFRIALDCESNGFAAPF